jgi:hypothetical protein
MYISRVETSIRHHGVPRKNAAALAESSERNLCIERTSLFAKWRSRHIAPKLF